MMWQAYEKWRSVDTGERPEISLVDGFLAGAAISLSPSADEQWIGAIVAGTSDLDQAASAELAIRLSTKPTIIGVIDQLRFYSPRLPPRSLRFPRS